MTGNITPPSPLPRPLSLARALGRDARPLRRARALRDACRSLRLPLLDPRLLVVRHLQPVRVVEVEGREPVTSALGADRVTRSSSRAGGRDNGTVGRDSTDTDDEVGGQIVRRPRINDWAAYLIREGQNARLEAWLANHDTDEDQEMEQREDEGE